MNFWDGVKSEIRRQNTTQEWVANHAGIGIGTFRSAISRGNEPALGRALAIAKALNVSVEYLAAGTIDKDSRATREFAASFYSEDCTYVRKMRNTKGMAEKTRLQKRRYVEEFILKCDWLMDMRVADVSRRDIERFRDDYLIATRFEDEPCRTTQMVMEVAKTIFGQAVEAQLIKGNPVYRLSTGKYDKAERLALSEQQLDDLLKEANFGHRRYYLATMIAATTGMRAGEVRGLRWGDLLPAEGLIRIDRALKNESSEVGLPKWGKRRVCPYPSVLRELLEPARKASGYLFAWGETESLGYSHWKDGFYRACIAAVSARVEADRAAGRKEDSSPIDTTLHGLRHTLNTCLLARGIPDAVIRAALGWSDPKIQERYTHIAFGDRFRSPIIDSVEAAIHGK